MRRSATVVFILSVVVGGCGDNSKPPGAPDAGVDAAIDVDARIEPPVTQYCRAISEVICGGLSSCGCRFDTRAYDAAGCVEARTTACVENTAAQAADVASGRAEVEPVSLARCVAALQAKATSCDTTELPPECRDTLLSTAAIGGTCELAGGGLAFCADGAGVCGPGDACLALPAAGEACLGGVMCARDLACVEGTCAAAGGAGDACAPGSCGGPLVCGPAGECVARASIDGVCAADEHCAEGLRCEQGGKGGTCRPAAAQGAACTGPGQCGVERSCVPAPETRTCTTPDGVGDACENDSCGEGLSCSPGDMTCIALPGENEACLDNQCADGLTCADGLNTCVPLPGVGEACAIGEKFCAAGLGCNELTQMCEAPGGAGAACLLNPPDYLCAPGFGCDFDQGQICVAQAAAGGACSSDRGCVASTYCETSTNTCTPRLAAGSACEDGNECQTGHECALVAGAYVCRAIPTVNQPCLFECANDLACKGPGGQCAPAICATP